MDRAKDAAEKVVDKADDAVEAAEPVVEKTPTEADDQGVDRPTT